MSIHTTYSDPVMVFHEDFVDATNEDGFIDIGNFIEKTDRSSSYGSLVGRASSSTGRETPPTDSANSSVNSSQSSLSSEDTRFLSEQLEEIVFDRTLWNFYFGDVGIAPTLPSDLLEILQSPCPFFSGKSVEETHKLILVPKTINGKTTTLNTLTQISTTSQYANLYRFNSNIDNKTKNLFGEHFIRESYWLLITPKNIPGSTSLSYEEQKDLVTKCPSYSMPSAIEMSILTLVESIQSAPNQDSASTATFTRCQDFIHSKNTTEAVVAKHFPLTSTEFRLKPCTPLDSCGTNAVRRF